MGIQEGNGPHGEFVATYVNHVAHANRANPPAGSMLGKENYASEGESTLNSYTVMRCIEGYDPENGDWFWARYDAEGGVTHSGMVGMCIGCHFDANGDDFVFLND